MAEVAQELVVQFGTETADLIKGMYSAESFIKGAVSRITRILGPLAIAMAAKKTFSGYVSGADALGKFADSIGENVSAIDAWGLAVRQAGGTAEGFQSSVDSLARGLNQVALTGKGRAKAGLEAFGISAKDANGNVKKSTDLLMELAGKAETMSKEQFRGLAQTLGIDKGTIMLLQQGKKSVHELVKEMTGMAITKEDAELAARFNTEWQNMAVSFRNLAAILFRAVTPVLTKVVKIITNFVTYMRKHETFLLTFLGLLATLVMARVVPAFVAWAASLLANPITWFVIAAALLALVLEDVYMWATGGKSAIKDFLLQFEGGAELVASIERAFKELEPVIEKLKPLFKGFFWKAFDNQLKSISATIEMLVNGINVLIKLFSGDFKGAVASAQSFVKAGIKKIASFSPAGMLVQTLRANKDAGNSFDASLGTTTRSRGGQNITNNTELHVGEITIKSNATDTEGIAKDIHGGLGREMPTSYTNSVGGSVKVY